MDVLSLMSRYEKILKERKIPNMQFYKDCGISDATASQWRKGKHTPSMTALNRIAEYLSVSTEWLITGIDPHKTEKEPATSGDELSEEERQFILWYRNQASEKDKAIVKAIVEADSK